MKHFILILFSLFTVVSCAAQGPVLRMGVITDTHYLSPTLMDGGSAMQDYVLRSGKNVEVVPAALDQVLTDYLNSDIEVLLICGDMTKDGEKQSHIDFAAKLKPLQEKGIKIYVIPGNHDINRPDAVEFRGNKKLKVANVSPDEFTDIYADCGYRGALKYDTASLSYVAKLNHKTWLLAIDAAFYSTGEASSRGNIEPDTEQWIVDVLDEAQGKGIQVVGMMHWGLNEHIPYQSMVFPEYLIFDWQRLQSLFADKGMKAIFTGHFHSNDITAFTSDAGNTIYDVETGTLSAYPFAYRFVSLSADAMDIATKHVTSLPDFPNLANDDKVRMRELAKDKALGKLKKMGLDMSDETTFLFAGVLGEVFVLHAYGDEKVDDNLRLRIKELIATMNGSTDELLDFQLDFPPADNDVRIEF